MPKKFLFITNTAGGIGNFTIPILEAAQKRGYEFHMAADFSSFKGDAEKYGIIMHQIDLNRFPLHPKNIRAFRQMNALMKSEGFDALHCNTPVGGLLGRLCGSRCGVRKIIYTAHGFHFYKGAPLINRIIYKPLERLMAHKTDALITITHEDYAAAQSFKLRRGGKAYYVPGVGTDTERFENAGAREQTRASLSVKPEETLIVSVGELNLNKNNSVIIRALARSNDNKIKYFLCGVGPQKDALCALSESLNVSDRVTFLGYRTDIPDIFSAADIFVLPSLREGLSRSIMEAMASSLPCVVSDIRGNCDLIKNGSGGYLCPPTDDASFAQAFETISGDKALARHMGEYNREAVKTFDVKNVKCIIDEIYSEIVD